MGITHYELKWPGKNIPIDLCAHELSRYGYHWHEEEYEIDILLSGKGEFCCEGSMFTLEENDVILINCKDGHGSFTLEPNTFSIVLRFSSEAFRKYVQPDKRFKFRCVSGKATRNTPAFCRLRAYAAQILEAQIHRNAHAELAVGGAMELLVYTLFRSFPPTQIPHVQPKDDERRKSIGTIIKYVDRHFSQKITLDDLARITGYNRTYVSTFFKENVGMNFYEYLTRVRFVHALYDLDKEEKNLTEIAIDNGFPDLKTFNYRFRDLFHMYPSEYRLMAKEVTPRKNFNQRRYCEEDNELVGRKIREYLGE